MPRGKSLASFEFAAVKSLNKAKVLALAEGRAEIAAISAPLADVVERLNDNKRGSGNMKAR